MKWVKEKVPSFPTVLDPVSAPVEKSARFTFVPPIDQNKVVPVSTYDVFTVVVNE